MKYKPLPHSIRIGIGMVFLLSGIPFANAATDCAAVTEIPKTQCEALVSLYNATVDPIAGWTDNTDWNNTDTPCSWKGITCTGSSDPKNVTAIDLSANNLVGTLPGLSAFSELQSLKLNGNQLTGNFPDLTALTKLQVLDLSNNQFSGAIPGLTTLTLLTTINVSGNVMVGTTPPQLCVDPAVNYGDTIQAQLTGTPNNLLYCKCTTITELSPSQCQALFTLYKDTDGPNWSWTSKGWDTDTDTPCTTPWEGIKCDQLNITEIKLSSHGLKGTLPDLSKFPGLQILDLSNNSLSGTLPSALSSLVNLTTISLNGNGFTGLIPELNGLINLTALSLKNNQLEGPIPALDQLTTTKLLTLELSGNIDSGKTALCKDPTRQDSYGEWAPWDATKKTWATADNDLDAYSTCTGIISGTKFADILDNGLKDAGEPGLPNQTVTAKNTTTNEEFPNEEFPSELTGPDGAYTLTVPYGTYAITSGVPDPNTQQQTTPVRNPPLTTPLNVEINWTKKDEKVNFGVHGLTKLTLSKSETNKDHSITATTSDSKLSCDTTACTFYYSSNQEVELEAISNLVGSNFAAWTGDCATTNVAKSTIMMDGNKSCGVRFQNFACTRVMEIPVAECNALIALFDSTSGKSWTSKEGWRNTLTPCSWKGISCDGGKVTAIDLSNNNLLGSLPSDFSALSGLQTFDVSGNSGLTGALPESLTSISSLNELKVSSGVCENLNGAGYGTWDDKLGNIGLSSDACAQMLPVADFNILPPTGTTLTVGLVASGFDLDGDYFWTSSCGQTATGQKTSITFSKAMPCDITLTVTDSAKNTIQSTPTSVVAPAILTIKKIAVDPKWEATLEFQVDLVASGFDLNGDYLWTSSCGKTATGQKTSITFPKATPCDITLTVTDSAKNIIPPITQTGVVAPAILTVNKTTGVNLGAPTLESQAVNNLAVKLDASLSEDTDGEIVSYNWTTSCGPTSTDGPITSITFLQAATCDITLTVTDDAKGTNSITKKVTVPMASLIVTKTGEGAGQVLMNPSNPVAVNCFPEVCVSQQGNYFPGTTVQLTAKPYPGAIFTGWGGDCSTDGSPVGGRFSALLSAKNSVTYPAGTTYHWTTSCHTTTDPTPKFGPTGTGMETSITLPESSICDITLTVKNAAGTVIGSPFEQKQVKVPVITPIVVTTSSGGAEAFQILPPRISIVVDEGAKNCTANFDVDPDFPFNLEVQLWDIKTNQQTESAGQIIDNRLTINVGDGYTKAKTYYEPGKRVKLKSIPNHVQKTNSGANTYWEFVRWECLDENQQPPIILGAQTQKKPLLRFEMPATYTTCKAYFNSDEDIAGQELRTKTYKEGTIDTGETPSERYPMDKGNNAARLREALYWAQPAILAIEAIVDLKNIDETWPKTDDPNNLLDKEFFRPAPAGKEKEEGKEYTKSVRIRPKDAEVKGFLSTSTVEGYYIEVRVMLMNKDGEEEEVPELIHYGDNSNEAAESSVLPSGGGTSYNNLAVTGLKRGLRASNGNGNICVSQKPPPSCRYNPSRCPCWKP